MPIAQSILDRKGGNVATIDHQATALQAAKLMNERHIGAVVVTKGDVVIGIFTERDILNRIVAMGRPPDATTVASVMTSPMMCCRRDTPLSECRAVMTNKRIRHLPVVEDGKLYGMISAGDILASEVVGQQQTIEYLEEYLYRRS